MSPQLNRDISEARSFAELLGLSSFAVAQPILATFGADAGSFVTARASGMTIVVFALIVVLVPPTLIWLTERLVGSVRPHPTRLVSPCIDRRTRCDIRRAGIARQCRHRSRRARSTRSRNRGGRHRHRSELARQFLGYLAFAPLLFLILFFITPVSRLLFTHDPPTADQLACEGDPPPIVMIVLDELPLNSLLDGNGNIDADAFPGLGELAENATFARNHTTVSPSTTSAVPAILTGLYPTSKVTWRQPEITRGTCSPSSVTLTRCGPGSM